MELRANSEMEEQGRRWEALQLQHDVKGNKVVRRVLFSTNRSGVSDACQSTLWAPPELCLESIIYFSSTSYVI